MSGEMVLPVPVSMTTWSDSPDRYRAKHTRWSEGGRRGVSRRRKPKVRGDGSGRQRRLRMVATPSWGSGGV